MHISCNEGFRHQVSRPDVEINLMHAALLIAADEYPDLDVPYYLARLAAWANEIRERVVPRTSAALQIRQLNRYLFHDLGFGGNPSEYFDPRNSYMNEVLERRRGIPITLSLVYMELGRRLGLCLSGISFPGHFLVKFPYGGGEVVLDPFHGGVSLSTQDLVQRLQAVLERDIDSPGRFLSAASNKQILARMLLNLKGIYQQQGKIDKVISVLNKLLLVMPDMMSEYRERGLLLNALGCHHAALDDLHRYLSHKPDAPDAGAIRELIFDLRETYGRLN